MRIRAGNLVVACVVAALVAGTLSSATMAASAGRVSTTAGGNAAADDGTTGARAYVVTVAAGIEPLDVARDVGVVAFQRYDDAINGFAAELNGRQLTDVTIDPRVLMVAEDIDLSFGGKKKPPPPAPVVPQFTSWGQDRMGLNESRTADVDGKGGDVDVDVAVLDTGVNAHDDLNVVGGIDCAGGSRGYADINGHGTQVAGFAAARDNAFGGVGVAPGARVHAVRVANDNGVVRMSAAICGLEWVRDSAISIDVANLSFGAAGTDDVACGEPSKGKGKKGDPLHEAVCAAVDAGVVVVAAAGNDAEDAAGQVPAAYPEVIAVSAFTETDGLPGGLGPDASCLSGQRDDHLATFSNYGAVIDFAAPGVCVAQTADGVNYFRLNGTSFAAPHVAGAAALVRARNPGATPAQVQAILLDVAEYAPLGGDPDGIAEPIINVSKL